MMAKQSFLVAVIGQKNGMVAQCFDKREEGAESAVKALFADTFNEVIKVTRCIDVGAVAWTYFVGSAAYIEMTIAP